MSPENPPELSVVKTCIKCGLDFECFDRWNMYADWCYYCFAEIPPKDRFPKTTPEEIVQLKARQEKTRQSLKQRALDKKNKVGKTAGKKKDDDDRPDEDSLIFNSPTE